MAASLPAQSTSVPASHAANSSWHASSAHDKRYVAVVEVVVVVVPVVVVILISTSHIKLRGVRQLRSFHLPPSKSAQSSSLSKSLGSPSFQDVNTALSPLAADVPSCHNQVPSRFASEAPIHIHALHVDSEQRLLITKGCTALDLMESRNPPSAAQTAAADAHGARSLTSAYRNFESSRALGSVFQSKDRGWHFLFWLQCPLLQTLSEVHASPRAWDAMHGSLFRVSVSVTSFQPSQYILHVLVPVGGVRDSDSL